MVDYIYILSSCCLIYIDVVIRVVSSSFSSRPQANVLPLRPIESLQAEWMFYVAAL